MPEPVAPPSPPAVPAAPPAAPAPPAGEPPAGPLAAPPTPAPNDPEAMARALQQANREAAAARTELKKLQDAQKVAADAQLSEEEKRAARITELEKALADREGALRAKTGMASVVDAAARLGATKPAMIHRLIEPDIEYDEDGLPKNVDVLIKEFLKANPEFASTAGRPIGSADQGPRGKSTLTREDIKKMTPDQINARWAEVSEVLARGA